MSKDLNINNFPDDVRQGLEEMQKELGFPTLMGFLKVVLTEMVKKRKKHIDILSGILENER